MMWAVFLTCGACGFAVYDDQWCLNIECESFVLGDQHQVRKAWVLK